MRHSDSSGQNGKTAVQETKSTDNLIRILEQEAYIAVLRAFGAQSEHITWAKERLISDLRKELRVTDEQHREFLARVSRDDALRQIQQASGAPPLHPSPPVLHLRKKQRTAAVPQLKMQPATTASPTKSQTPLKKSAAAGMSRGKSNGSQGKTNGVQGKDHWVGQFIKTRWPADNNFYEAYVKDYHKEDGTHTLVYDMGKDNESSERVNISTIAPEDIQINGTTERKLYYSVSKRRIGHKLSRDAKQCVNPFGLSLVDSLVKQVEDLEHETDLSKLQHAQMLAKEHEETLRKALVEVGESSDEGESDGAPHMQSNSYSRNTAFNCDKQK